MTPRTLRFFADIEHVCLAAADEFVRIAHASCLSRQRFTVALGGGSTPKRLYQHLAQPPYREKIDWSKVEFFWGDERAVPPEHPDSNFGMANQALLQKLALPAGQIHRMAAERPDLDAAAAEYQQELARTCGVPADGPPPALDLVLLGMGPDGHTASLFPHTAALAEKQRWVVGNFVPKFNAHRMTMTAGLINRAAHVLFLVAGADKAPALASVLEGPFRPDEFPSQMIKPTTGTLTWLVDEAAAALCQAK